VSDWLYDELTPWRIQGELFKREPSEWYVRGKIPLCQDHTSLHWTPCCLLLPLRTAYCAYEPEFTDKMIGQLSYAWKIARGCHFYWTVLWREVVQIVYQLVKLLSAILRGFVTAGNCQLNPFWTLRYFSLRSSVILYTFLRVYKPSSVSIVSGYGLDDRAIGVRFPAGAKDFSSSLCVQTVSGAHPASCKMGTGGPFPGGKARPGRDADHSPTSSTEVENE
jgi:hypothetical protein